MGIEFESFEQWLDEYAEFSPRSKSDVVSRLRRLSRHVNPLDPKSDDELDFRLKQAGPIAGYSSTVRSQLKRAAVLYRRFAHDANLTVAEPNGAAPTFIDLFAGAGGLSLGLVHAGWKPLLALDNWDDAVATYRKNFKSHPIISKDVTEVSGEGLVDIAGKKPSWIVGGPPCQGFSTVGKRVRKDPRNLLIIEFLRIVEEVQPDGVLIENVLGLRDMNFVSAISARFSDLGYRVTPLVLKAADYGVPQLRRRVLFIADRFGRLFIPPRPSHIPEQYVTVSDAISDLPELRPGERAQRYDRPPATAYQELLRMGSESIQGHHASKHPSRLVKAISHIPDGGNRRSIPPEYQPKSGFHNSYSRLHSGSPAVAVTQNMGKPSGTRCIHPFQHRGLTAREGARLQGFPDAYHFEGGITSQRLQIANAVPPILARRLAWSLISEKHWSSSVSALSTNDFYSGQLALPLEELQLDELQLG